MVGIAAELKRFFFFFFQQNVFPKMFSERIVTYYSMFLLYPTASMGKNGI